MERMEREGIVGPANHAGKREILVEPRPPAGRRGLTGASSPQVPTSATGRGSKIR